MKFLEMKPKPEQGRIARTPRPSPGALAGKVARYGNANGLRFASNTEKQK